MKHLFACCVAASLALSLSAGTKDTKTDTVAGFAFTDVKVLPTTSVKDQNKSGTCWCFAGTSHLEDEILRKGGKELDLSEMYTVRMCYLDKADKYIRMDGHTNFSQGGSAADVPYVFAKYGAMPEEAYPGLSYGEDKHSHYEMAAVLKAYLDAIRSNPNKRLSTAWKKGFEAILDAYLGPVPETFVVDGKTYTPKSYAESLGLNMDDYVSVTSFTHHPFYTTYAIEVADNWLWAPSVNVPLNELKEIMDNAIENGYPIVWAADISEPSFKYNNGYAIMPKARTEADLTNSELTRWVKMSDADRQALATKITGPMPEIEVTQELRQEMLDRKETTDDHGMVIMGKAVDQKGNRYYKVKNSWDNNQCYGGFFYASEPFILAKTMNILVHKDALPKEIAKKLK